MKLTTNRKEIKTFQHHEMRVEIVAAKIVGKVFIDTGDYEMLS